MSYYTPCHPAHEKSKLRGKEKIVGNEKKKLLLRKNNKRANKITNKLFKGRRAESGNLAIMEKLLNETPRRKQWGICF